MASADMPGNVSVTCFAAYGQSETLWLGGSISYIKPWLPDLEHVVFAKSSFAVYLAMFWSCICSTILLLPLSSIAVPTGGADAYTSNAEAAFQTLQKWYNDTSGIYGTTGWWNSANGLTTLGDLAVVSPLSKPQVTKVLANSLVAAAETNQQLQATKAITSDFNILSVYRTIAPSELDAKVSADPKGFLNDYYDDEGWWALAWIQAYDITQNKDYLQAAIDIFADMKNGSTTPCGGIWWDKPQTYVNAIANELYLSVASHLANRSNKSFYLPIAQEQFSWFQESGMINSQNLINDGLTADCKNNNGTIWSYNQGVILGALVELNLAAPNRVYLTTASSIAVAAISSLSVNGILHDPCGTDCGADGSQFKGIFMRNLRKLQQAAPDPRFLAFVKTNARTIWVNDRNVTSTELGLLWEGPFLGPANASLQSSALDGLVAAAAFEGRGIAS